MYDSQAFLRAGNTTNQMPADMLKNRIEHAAIAKFQFDQALQTKFLTESLIQILTKTNINNTNELLQFNENKMKNNNITSKVRELIEKEEFKQEEIPVNSNNSIPIVRAIRPVRSQSKSRIPANSTNKANSK